MIHCYILDFVNCEVCHTQIPNDVEDIDVYLKNKYGFDDKGSHFMCSDNILSIKEI